MPHESERIRGDLALKFVNVEVRSCANGFHEAVEKKGFFAALKLSFDPLHEPFPLFPVEVCRHCRCLYAERP